ncbi:uncharacterized protein LOC128391363 [Panonychus citri]|uniref:uncharacterized protein LOC128391363 n=1 Tax=Panonychus citri TaxID=50023 RepID=UPI0023080454|nr:uncharacterized protein LOC128391363 [Panonychus citri]
MRFSIVLAICFLGVASASTLVKRNFFDDLQNKSQDALENLKNFGQDFNQKVQDALKNLLGNHNSTEHTIAKRAPNPLQLINDIKDPAAFVQDIIRDFIKVVTETALQGRRKRDLAEDLKKLADAGKEKTQEALKQLMDLLSSFNHGTQQDTTKAAITKRAPNPLQLIADIKDPVAFAQDLIKILAEMALKGRRKRDLAEDLKKLADAGKEKAQEALKQLMDLLNSFNHGQATTEAAITKRALNPLQLINDIKDPAAFAQDLIRDFIKVLETAIKG